LVGQTEHCRRT